MPNETIVISARTKAGRARIAEILDFVNSVTRIEVDNVTGLHNVTGRIDLHILRKLIETDGKSATLYEVRGNNFVYLTGEGRHMTRFEIHTVAHASYVKGFE